MHSFSVDVVFSRLKHRRGRLLNDELDVVNRWCAVAAVKAHELSIVRAADGRHGAGVVSHRHMREAIDLTADDASTFVLVDHLVNLFVETAKLFHLAVSFEFFLMLLALDGAKSAHSADSVV